jgi:hypothetical protein
MSDSKVINPRTVNMTFTIVNGENEGEEKVFLKSYNSTPSAPDSIPQNDENLVTKITHEGEETKIGDIEDENLRTILKKLQKNVNNGGSRRTKHRKSCGGKKSMRRYKKNRKH